MRCGAVVLAAGSSSRLREPKQLVDVGGERLLERAVRCCVEAELWPVFVVLGANAELIEASCDLRGAQLVMNDAWAEGMGSSVRVGIAHADAAGLDAAVVTTCDMPFVTSHHLLALAAYAEEAGCDVASMYDGRRGVPACFLRGSFAVLGTLRGDTGARELLRTAPFVELLDAMDIDTVEALAAAREHWEREK